MYVYAKEHFAPIIHLMTLVFLCQSKPLALKLLKYLLCVIMLFDVYIIISKDYIFESATIIIQINQENDIKKLLCLEMLTAA